MSTHRRNSRARYPDNDHCSQAGKATVAKRFISAFLVVMLGQTKQKFDWFKLRNRGSCLRMLELERNNGDHIEFR